MSMRSFCSGDLLVRGAPNPQTKNPGFREFDSSKCFISGGGIPRSIGNSPESLSQAVLAGTIVVGRLGVEDPKTKL